ncbi:MAG: amidohydrolase family protein [Gammaproteobacteria bacterium]|nr:amidohydrolase family protein [Gammaproteobacteria bacterium]MDP6675373.1 amidohydrolase family protein [Gammaproteobacteria bacterium]
MALPVSPDELRSEDQSYLAALSMQAAEKVLMHGWTTVRDMGGPSQGLARAIDEGIAVGPHVYPSAMFISQTSGHGDFRGLNDPHPNMGGPADIIGQRYTLIADGTSRGQTRRARSAASGRDSHQGHGRRRYFIAI